MRKFDTKVQYLKYKVLREVAKQAWNGTLLENLMDIPKIIVPGNEPTMYEKNGEFVELGKGATALLCTETNGRSFTGVFLGVFTENGEITVENVALRELDK